MGLLPRKQDANPALRRVSSAAFEAPGFMKQSLVFHVFLRDSPPRFF